MRPRDRVQAAPEQAAADRPPMPRRLQPALTLFTVREFTQTPADIGRTLKRVKQIGFEHVQLSALGHIDPRELKRMLDGEGLSAVATHIGLARLRDELPAVIDEHQILGCPHVAIGALPDTMRNAAGYAAFAREGSEIGRRLAAAGLTFSYHNHWWELEAVDGLTGLDRLYDESDPRALLAEIDTAWIYRGGGDPAVWIRKLSGRQRILHLKDTTRPEYPTLELGAGEMDWPEILAAADEAEIEYGIIEQDHCPDDPFVCVAASMSWLRQWLT